MTSRDEVSFEEDGSLTLRENRQNGDLDTSTQAESGITPSRWTMTFPASRPSATSGSADSDISATARLTDSVRPRLLSCSEDDNLSMHSSTITCLSAPHSADEDVAIGVLAQGFTDEVDGAGAMSGTDYRVQQISHLASESLGFNGSNAFQQLEHGCDRRDARPTASTGFKRRLQSYYDRNDDDVRVARSVQVTSREYDELAPHHRASTAGSFSVPAGYLELDEFTSTKGLRLDHRAVRTLKRWFCAPAHWNNPYPTETEKADLAALSGLTVTQVCNWLRNERKRIWLPLKRFAVHGSLQSESCAPRPLRAAGISASETAAAITASGAADHWYTGVVERAVGGKHAEEYKNMSDQLTLQAAPLLAGAHMGGAHSYSLVPSSYNGCPPVGATIPTTHAPPPTVVSAARSEYALHQSFRPMPFSVPLTLFHLQQQQRLASMHMASTSSHLNEPSSSTVSMGRSSDCNNGRIGLSDSSLLAGLSASVVPVVVAAVGGFAPLPTPGTAFVPSYESAKGAGAQLSLSSTGGSAELFGTADTDLTRPCPPWVQDITAYKGLHRSSSLRCNSWGVRVFIKAEQRQVNTFSAPTIEDTARQYDRWAYALQGARATLNFPEVPPKPLRSDELVSYTLPEDAPCVHNIYRPGQALSGTLGYSLPEPAPTSALLFIPSLPPPAPMLMPSPLPLTFGGSGLSLPSPVEVVERLWRALPAGARASLHSRALRALGVTSPLVQQLLAVRPEARARAPHLGDQAVAAIQRRVSDTAALATQLSVTASQRPLPLPTNSDASLYALVESRAEYLRVALARDSLAPALPARIAYDLSLDTLGTAFFDDSAGGGGGAYECPVGYSVRRAVTSPTQPHTRTVVCVAVSLPTPEEVAAIYHHSTCHMTSPSASSATAPPPQSSSGGAAATGKQQLKLSPAPLKYTLTCAELPAPGWQSLEPAKLWLLLDEVVFRTRTSHATAAKAAGDDADAYGRRARARVQQRLSSARGRNSRLCTAEAAETVSSLAGTEVFDDTQLAAPNPADALFWQPPPPVSGATATSASGTSATPAVARVDCLSI